MLIAFLLVLSAVKVNSEVVDQDGLRTARQLDLGLQDIRGSDDGISTTVGLPSSQKGEVNNGYLPPISSSLSPDISGAQSQQTFDFKSVNFVEKESDLCKPPFDQESCRSKDSSTSDSKIPKPSRDLVPPFNDLEQELANKATTLFEKTNEEIKTTVDVQTTFTTTTSKPATKLYKPSTKIYKPAATHNIARFRKTTLKPRPVASTAEATNELRSYLPPQPEFSAAAQTNVAVVQPTRQNNDHDHHHHHHHHGENFNICDDPFHAFLCAPLKARKRITGALPASLLGQSSYINYQKTLRNFDRDTAPSNTVGNEYLPPKPSPTNFIQPIYQPSVTTARPVGNEYLPPKPSPTNFIQPIYQPSVTTARPVTTTTTTTIRPYSPPRVIPESSNTNDRLYLPPLPSSFPAEHAKPASSDQAFSTVTGPTTPVPNAIDFFSKTTPAVFQSSIFQSVSPTVPILSSLSSQENTFYLPPKPSPQPAASFVSTSQSVLPIVSTITPIITSTLAPLPTVTSFAPLPSNSIFVPEKPKVQPTVPILITAKPSTLVENLQAFSTVSSAFPTALPTIQTTPKPVLSVSPFSSQPSNPSGSYLPPVSSTKPPTTTVNPPSINFYQQSSNAERAYLPPDPNEPAAAQISSAAVAAPQSNNPFHHGRDLCTDPFHSFLCASAKPRKRITGDLPTGFNPDSSNTNELRLKPEPSNQDESSVQKLLEGAAAQNVGYNYPKPINPFPTPTTVLTSTLAPSTGYSYPKPEKIFPLPSQQDFKVVSTTTRKPEPVYRPSEAKVITGYQYPKPEKIFPLPAGQDNIKIITTTSAPTTGYSYPRPQKPFPLPSDQKEVRLKPKPKVTASSTASLSLPTNTVRGYQYPKPDQSLKLPEKKGYSYPKPDKRLELPTEGRPKFKLPQTSNSDPLGSLGSADFIPVNKVEFKRAENSKLLMGLRRFGERMRKRERDAQLYRKQVH